MKKNGKKIDRKKIKSISIISPFHNESKNLEILYKKLINVSFKLLDNNLLDFIEIILIDDGSTDDSLNIILDSIKTYNPLDYPEFQNKYNNINNAEKIKLILIKLKQNLGQSYALSTGFQIAQGDIIITIDSDLQNDPFDIIKLFENIKKQDVEVISGYRINRNEGFRVIASLIGNKLIKLVSNYNIQDVGCSLKAYNQKTIKNLKLPYGYHRFLPIIAFVNKEKISNIEVNFSPRIFGKSHYGYSRVIWLLLRLLTLYILKGYNSKQIKTKLFLISLITLILLPLVLFTLFNKSFIVLNFIALFILVYNLFTIEEVYKFLKFQKEDILKNSEFVLNLNLNEIIVKNLKNTKTSELITK